MRYKVPAHREDRKADARALPLPAFQDSHAIPGFFSLSGFVFVFLTVLIMFIYMSALITAAERACNYCI